MVGHQSITIGSKLSLWSTNEIESTFYVKYFLIIYGDYKCCKLSKIDVCLSGLLCEKEPEKIE